ncbi:hypothetical protein [Allonocardiopsis opalescens]|uniref:Uncharacterized protein n=1 Tax=Allonocardiopsis opalescens TaxID=1144618 RepID=A0A2T0Q7H2_9ACTN|nr:hypothetical protein [Allonocardiopsis opalescens]PRX99673.1 hypothetical protein CLV72_103278 [Allonocardiopsis opalescens]
MAAVTAAVLTGCAAQQTGAVQDTVHALYAAAAAGDGAAACALLTPEAARSLASADSGCPEEIVSLGLDGGEIESTEVWSGAAQVRLDRDTVFLTEFPQGWLVHAAGCTPRPGLPYACEVEG